MDGECGDHRRNPPPIFFSILPKRKRAVDGPKEKNASAGRSARSAYLRPPAGEGWPCLAAALMKRDALGESMGPGRARIPRPPLSAGAALAVNAGRRGRRPLQSAAGNPVAERAHKFAPTAAQRSACRPIHRPRRGGCPHPPVSIPHPPPSKAQADFKEQSFRQPPRSLCQAPTRGGRAERMPKSGASR